MTPTTSTSHSRSQGFTLIELLTVIAIIGILASIIIPVVGKVRMSARRAQSVSNMRQVVAATLLYANDNKDALPDHTDITGWNVPAYTAIGDSYVSGKLINPYLPWMHSVWFDPLTSQQMDRAGKIAANPGYATWVARPRYNARLTYEWRYAGLPVPVRISTIVRPSNALLYYNGNSEGWAGYPDEYGTVGFADGSARRIRDGKDKNENLITKTYIAVKAGAPFPGFLE